MLDLIIGYGVGALIGAGIARAFGAKTETAIKIGGIAGLFVAVLASRIATGRV